ncbi:TPA: hypothetical protein MIG96_22795 [Klebsiella pneumoniae]|uniref:hypothetical protein n=1 Tax=Klebsiella variicola TaxID=244366 RepID=UPI002404A7A3|nr:hypothetical protein [Klebsiella variicola]MDG0346712.1 hypothetical protein [Klebsiella variicola]MDG0347304.1 hypothetical protein [Klebsiella variicola]HBX7941117.1 hypothetical protein [Klebsiella pneumoniae]
MSFKLARTFTANLTTDTGMNLGQKQVTVDLTCRIALITITTDGTARATITSAVGDSDPVQTDIFEFSYSMSSGIGMYEQALAQILASEKYAGAVAN